MEYKQFTLTSKHHQRKFLADARYLKNSLPKPVIIFNHGFKGFKDWGHFNLVSEFFANRGFIFIKMNFSHNGTTLEIPTAFADLEAFANNNFCIELDDTGVLIDALFTGLTPVPKEEMDLNNLFLIGHSRGGGHVILKAKEDQRVKGIVTWAAVNNLETWHTTEELEYWKRVGTIYVHNSRTNQEMPMHYQIVENYRANRERLQIPEAIKTLKIPVLVMHGTDDQTVDAEAARMLKRWNPAVALDIMDGADHTFGGTHPWKRNSLPVYTKYAAEKSSEFLKQTR